MFFVLKINEKIAQTQLQTYKAISQLFALHFYRNKLVDYNCLRRILLVDGAVLPDNTRSESSFGHSPPYVSAIGLSEVQAS
jgi:hypothetical protein